MDRNTVIGTVLIALIMVVWLYWLTPPPPPPGTSPVAPDSSSVVEAVPATPEVQDPAHAAVPSVPAAAPDSLLAGALQGDARLITVDTDRYEAQFSTKGATLVSFKLKDYYKSDRVTPVQLVDSASVGALALVFTTPTNHLVDTRTFFFEPSVSADRIEVSEGGQELSFLARVGAGSIRQTYTFTPGSYEVGLRIEQTNASSFATSEGYELILDGAIPFSEEDHQKSAEVSGVFGRSGGELEKIVLDAEPYEEKTLRGAVDWISVRSKFFTSVVIPNNLTPRGAELIGERFGEREDANLREYYQARLLMPPATGQADQYQLYLGPLSYYQVSTYDLGLFEMVDFGWDAFEWMTRPLAKYIFIPALHYFGQWLPNYGLVIILIAVLMKLVLFPLTKSSYKSMARMKELQPMMEEIKEKYKDNPQKQQEATMKMYRESGVNPLGGCLPMVLQYPVIIALWQFLPQSIEIRQQGFLWAQDLSAPDAILNLPFDIPIYGDFVGGFTLLMGLSMVVQMKIQMASTASNTQAKIFTYVFPVMIFAIFNRLASGLSLYYLCFNVLTAIQQRFINKTIHEEAEAKKQEASSPRKNGKAKKAPRAARNGQSKSRKGKATRTR